MENPSNQSPSQTEHSPTENIPPKKRLSKFANEFQPSNPVKPAEKPPAKKSSFNKPSKHLDKNYFQKLQTISNEIKEEIKHTFKNRFLRLEEYSNLESVRRCFDPLGFINDNALRGDELSRSRAIVIRSRTYDDIHKALKYGVWASSADNNEFISKIYDECKKNNQRLLLFFRANKDDLFCGVAEIKSGYIEEQKFSLWWDNQKWKGIFNIRWVFVKNLNLMSLPLLQHGIPVKDLRDGEELIKINKEKLLIIFANIKYNFEESVLKFFPTFDQREDQLISNRTVLDFEFKLQKREKRERGERRKRKCSLIEGDKALRTVKEEQPLKGQSAIKENNNEGKKEESEGKLVTEEGNESTLEKQQILKEKKKLEKKKRRKRQRQKRKNQNRNRRDSYEDDRYHEDRNYDYKDDFYYDDDYYYVPKDTKKKSNHVENSPNQKQEPKKKIQNLSGNKNPRRKNKQKNRFPKKKWVAVKDLKKTEEEHKVSESNN